MNKWQNSACITKHGQRSERLIFALTAWKSGGKSWRNGRNSSPERPLMITQTSGKPRLLPSITKTAGMAQTGGLRSKTHAGMIEGIYRKRVTFCGRLGPSVKWAELSLPRKDGFAGIWLTSTPPVASGFAKSGEKFAGLSLIGLQIRPSGNPIQFVTMQLTRSDWGTPHSTGVPIRGPSAKHCF